MGKDRNVASARPHLWFSNKVKIFVRIGKGWAPKSLKTATNLDDVFVWEVSIEWHTGQTLSIAWFFSIFEEYYSEASTVTTKRIETVPIVILLLFLVLKRGTWKQKMWQVSALKFQSRSKRGRLFAIKQLELENLELFKPKLDKIVSKLELKIKIGWNWNSMWVQARTFEAQQPPNSMKSQLVHALTITVPCFLVMTVAMKSSFF